jgi:hypothetical protein
MSLSGYISLVAELIAYTVRYLRADGVFARISEIRCTDDTDALRQAASEMRGDYTALEIVSGTRLVWRGLREDAIAALAR